MAAYDSIKQMGKMLTNLDAWIAKAVEHATKKGFDPNVFVTTRLALDMFPLARQVQSACDAAKIAAARLAGKEAPKHEDNEKTIDELRARIRIVNEYLGGFSEADFKEADTRTFELPFLPGQKVTGLAYFNEFAQPNFYFHVTTAYDILRHNGVELGKRDYIGGFLAKP